MQNQVNMNQVNLNQVSMNVETSTTTNQPQFIIQGIPAIQGGVVNLAELLNKANAGMNTQTRAEHHDVSGGGVTFVSLRFR